MGNSAERSYKQEDEYKRNLNAFKRDETNTVIEKEPDPYRNVDAEFAEEFGDEFGDEFLQDLRRVFHVGEKAGLRSRYEKASDNMVMSQGVLGQCEEINPKWNYDEAVKKQKDNYQMDAVGVNTARAVQEIINKTEMEERGKLSKVVPELDSKCSYLFLYLFMFVHKYYNNSLNKK